MGIPLSPYPFRLELSNCNTLFLGLGVFNSVFSLPVSFENRKDIGVLPFIPSSSFYTSLVEVIGKPSISHSIIVKELNEVVCLLLGFRPIGRVVVT